MAESVDDLFALHRFFCEICVLRHERFDGALQHGNGLVRDLLDTFVWNFHVQRQQTQTLSCHALGVVADALELRIDLDDRVDEAQRASYGLLPNDELETEPIDLLVELVDALIA